MSDQLAALSLPFERVEAVYGTHMPDGLKPYFLCANDTIASELVPGEVGCYASHLKVMQMIADSGEPGLVLEDDLTLAPDLAAVLLAVQQLPNGWEIIRLSNTFRRHFFPVAALTGTYQVVKFARVPPNTGAYLITPQGARKFLNWKRLRTLPVDQDMRRTWDCGLVSYGVYPRPVVPLRGVSSIDAIARRPRRRRTRGGGVRDAIKRVTFDIGWLGARKWSLSLIPKTLPGIEVPSQRPEPAPPA